MSGSYQIVQLASLGAEVDAELARDYSVLPLWDEADPLPRLAEAPVATVVITSVRRGMRREWIEALPKLAAVCSWGVGYETLDVDAARERGIVLSNTPHVLDNCVADLAWALMFSTARRTSVGDRYVKSGQWTSIGAFPLSTRVWGKRLGVVGLGRIGAAIAKRGSGFDMEVRYHNRSERPDAPYQYEPSLVELARWADFLVLACPGGPATRHIVNREVLRALGPEGILVNIARGTVVDEAAMVEALERGELGGAGLDVVANEPNVPQALLSMDNVSLMPHVGSATRETRADMAKLVMENARAFLQEGRLVTPIS
ncbi:MAG TPA: 2-hydroxyacid dehydrogenase [Burkholderiaceae bacterium]|nr:2-hydroxyacid dehydrogenase [Burkholderiaceae bacterium]